MKISFIGLAVACLCCISAGAQAGATQDTGNTSMETVQHLGDFQALEFRRYHTSPGERAHFTTYFDTLFPEAMEQLGALVMGSFHERGDPTAFTWIRGFHTINDRAIANAAFYYGPVWKEYRTRVNAILPDSDNVLLLTPLKPENEVPVLPAVDPVAESRGARGVVVAQVFRIKPGQMDAFVSRAQQVFARYRAAGAREAGILVTLDVPNNFPQLPIRTDGPYLVWLGILQDDQVLKTRFDPIAADSQQFLSDTGLLASPPELVVMDPTGRSRLRWLPQWEQQ